MRGDGWTALDDDDLPIWVQTASVSWPRYCDDVLGGFACGAWPLTWAWAWAWAWAGCGGPTWCCGMPVVGDGCWCWAMSFASRWRGVCARGQSRQHAGQWGRRGKRQSWVGQGRTGQRSAVERAKQDKKASASSRAMGQGPGAEADKRARAKGGRGRDRSSRAGRRADEGAGTKVQRSCPPEAVTLTHAEVWTARPCADGACLPHPCPPCHPCHPCHPLTLHRTH